MVLVDSQIVACKRSLWRDRASVQRFAEQVEAAPVPQKIKNAVETDIVRRFARGSRILDVGIGTGRITFPLLREDVRLTGVDSSAVMIERCRARQPASAVRLVHAELERLPFAREAFDTVISVDTFAHYPDWKANLDELLRVTRAGGRTIVDLNSSDHVAAVAAASGSVAADLCGGEIVDPQAYVLRISAAELETYAAEREISLVALVPFGLVLGSLVPNYWLADSYACRSGALDRLISWSSTDSRFAAFLQFIERRIVQELPPAVSGRMFAVFERAPGAACPEPSWFDVGDRDERGSAAWHAEFALHAAHEPNVAFAAALMLAARPVRPRADAIGALPEALARELARCERAADRDAACSAAVAAWRRELSEFRFRGVDLSVALDEALASAFRARQESR